MRKKKLLALLLTLAMLVSMLPMAVLPAAAEPGPTVVSTYAALLTALRVNGATVQLAGDISLLETDTDPLFVPKDTTVTLDLNGHEIRAAYGMIPLLAGITVRGSLTLVDSKDNGTITGAEVGVYVIGNDAGTGTFVMSGGEIYKNGVGVAVKGGVFEMSGGYICGADTASVGVAVSGGSFAMSGGEIDDNFAGVAVSGGSFAMSGGDIYSNIVGVYMVGGDTSTASFTMSGGEIDWNDVGILAADRDFTVSGGYIYCNYIGVMSSGDKSTFTMDGGRILHNDYIGVLVGIGAEELGLNGTMSIDDALDELDGEGMSLLISENPARAGGTFAMSGAAAVEANGLINVIVSGYAVGDDYNAALTMSGNAAVRATLSDNYEEVDDSEYKDPMEIAIGVVAIDADVTMEGNAGIYGSYSEIYKDMWYLPSSIDIGAFISNGTLSMSDNTKISGHSALGVAGGYALDALAQIMEEEEIQLERRGTEIVMSDYAAIENSGVLGALLYGYSVDEDVKATLTMSGNAAIRAGEGAFLEIPVGEEDAPISIPGAGEFDIHLHPQLGLAAVGADVTMKDQTSISAPFKPFIKKLANDDVDVTLQLGAVMCDGKLDLSGKAKITGNNIGGVLMGYPDDLVNLVGRFLGDNRIAAQLLPVLQLGNKHGNIINLSGGGAISDNGLFGAFTVGAKDAETGKNVFAEVTMTGGSVSDNAVVGLTGIKTAYDLQNATIDNSLMGVLALLHSTLDIGEGTAITDNTVGAAAIAASEITLNGGAVTDNDKAFTVSGTGDSIDDLLALVGDYESLIPAAYRIYPDIALGALRAVLSGQISEGMITPIIKEINDLIGSDLKADDVMWVINLLNYGLENSQQTGIAVETLTSALHVNSGEIKRNVHGVSAFTVNSNLLKLISEDIPAFLAQYSATAGITLNGTDFELDGNDKSDVDLMSISVETLKQKVPPEAPILNVEALPADSAIRTGVYQLLVKQAADVEIEPAEDSTMLQAILCAIAEALHNVRVTVDPLPDVPFTEGLRGKGTADSFTSAIDGYNVTLNGDGEAMLSKPYTPSGVGGSKTYKVIVAATENGTATASKSTASEGEKITVTARPADGFELDSISVKGEKAGTVEVKDGAFTMPADDVTVTVKFKKADAKQTFSDVKPGDWFYEGVEYVAEKGWMQGPGGGVFQPNETTTRAMVAQVLWNMAGKPVVNAAIPFADVAEGAWYADAVRWAAEKGVVTGWTDENGKQVFDPEGKVTREQFAAMLYRYAKTLGKGFQGLWSFKLDFPDAGDVSPWATEAMSWMVMNGIINGMDGRLNPQGNSTRAQIAAMLQRFDTLG